MNEAKEFHQKLWASGDYPSIAPQLRDVSDAGPGLRGAGPCFCRNDARAHRWGNQTPRRRKRALPGSRSDPPGACQSSRRMLFVRFPHSRDVKMPSRGWSWRDRARLVNRRNGPPSHREGEPFHD